MHTCAQAAALRARLERASADAHAASEELKVCGCRRPLLPRVSAPRGVGFQRGGVSCRGGVAQSAQAGAGRDLGRAREEAAALSARVGAAGE